MNETPAISASSMFGKLLIKGTYNESPVDSLYEIRIAQ
jgi:hypothetical protein